jgi:hypothetical protein
MAKTKVPQGHKRTRKFTIKLSDHEHQKLMMQTPKSGATNPSRYIRAKLFGTGVEPKLAAWDHLRYFTNEVVKLRLMVEKVSRVTPAIERSIVDVLDRAIPHK